MVDVEVVAVRHFVRQGNDRGVQYRTGVYYTDEADLPVLRQVFDGVTT